jgi:hypothetical protein
MTADSSPAAALAAAAAADLQETVTDCAAADKDQQPLAADRRH